VEKLCRRRKFKGVDVAIATAGDKKRFERRPGGRGRSSLTGEEGQRLCVARAVAVLKRAELRYPARFEFESDG